MKTSYVISCLALVLWACHNDDIGPHMRIEAEIGEPFIVAAPAEITFKESGLTLYVESFSEYIDFGIAPPGSEAVIRYDDRKISLYHNLQCDNHDCEGYSYNENTFLQEAKLGELYKLTFKKVVASTLVKQYESGGNRFRVDSAQFVLRVND